MEKIVTITDEYVKSRDHRLYKRLRRAYDRMERRRRIYRTKRSTANKFRLDRAKKAFYFASARYEEARRVF